MKETKGRIDFFPLGRKRKNSVVPKTETRNKLGNISNLFSLENMFDTGKTALASFSVPFRKLVEKSLPSKLKFLTRLTVSKEDLRELRSDIEGITLETVKTAKVIESNLSILEKSLSKEAFGKLTDALGNLSSREEEIEKFLAGEVLKPEEAKDLISALEEFSTATNKYLQNQKLLVDYSSLIKESLKNLTSETVTPETKTNILMDLTKFISAQNNKVKEYLQALEKGREKDISEVASVLTEENRKSIENIISTYSTTSELSQTEIEKLKNVLSLQLSNIQKVNEETSSVIAEAVKNNGKIEEKHLENVILSLRDLEKISTQEELSVSDLNEKFDSMATDFEEVSSTLEKQTKFQRKLKDLFESAPALFSSSGLDTKDIVTAVATAIDPRLGALVDIFGGIAGSVGSFLAGKYGGKILSKIPGIRKFFPKAGKIGSVAGEAEAIAEKGSLVSRIFGRGKTLGSKVLSLGKGIMGIGKGSLVSRISGKSVGAVSQLGKIGKVGKILGTGGKFLGRLAGKVALPLTVATSLWDVYKGFSNAKEIAGKENVGLKEKIGASVSSLLSGLTLGFVKPQTIYKIGSKVASLSMGKEIDSKSINPQMVARAQVKLKEQEPVSISSQTLARIRSTEISNKTEKEPIPSPPIPILPQEKKGTLIPAHKIDDVELSVLKHLLLDPLF